MNFGRMAKESKFGSLSLFFSILWIFAYVFSLLAIRPLLSSGQPIGQIAVYALVFAIILCPLLGISYGLVAAVIKKEKNKILWKAGIALSLLFLLFLAYLKGTNSWI
ncbi:MAG: hypothetical protein QXK06_00975 [Candidatus Diapherotrites archaeon]